MEAESRCLINNIKHEWSEYVMFIDDGKGSVLSLGVGIVIGTAFSNIVSSFTGDILTPILGVIIPARLSENFLVIKSGPNGPYQTREIALADKAITWNYGAFVQSVLDFVMITSCLFVIVRVCQNMHKPVLKKSRRCPYCMTIITSLTRRCPACTSQVP
jgi:large conductance mechanosensitive channel